jgi:hypothetical protein
MILMMESDVCCHYTSPACCCFFRCHGLILHQIGSPFVLKGVRLWDSCRGEAVLSKLTVT